jgi:hypothetical protein
MTRSSRVATSNRAFLKVALQDITSREGVVAENTHIWTVTGVSQHVSLQMFRMEISLCAVGAGEFAISILLGNSALGGSVDTILHNRRPTWCAGQDASSAL